MGAIGSCVYEVEDTAFIAGRESEATRLRNRVAELEAVVRCLRGHRNANAPARGEVGGVPCVPRGSKETILPGDSSTDSGDDIEALPTCSTQVPSPSVHRISAGSVHRQYASSETENMMPVSNVPVESFQPKLLAGTDDSSGQQPCRLLVGAAGDPLLVALLNEVLGASSLVSPELVYDGYFDADGGLARDVYLNWQGPTDLSNIRSTVIKALPDGMQAATLLQSFQAIVEQQHLAWFSPALRSRFTSFFAASLEVRLRYENGVLALFCAILALSIQVVPVLPVLPALQKDVDLPSSTSYHRNKEKFKTNQERSKYSCYYTAAALRLLAYCETDPTLEAVQARLLLCIFLVNTGRLARLGVLLPIMIRHAQMLGLHVDPRKIYRSMPFVEQEIRRRIWWSIQEHDTFFSLVTGLPPCIANSDCDLPQDRTESSLLGPCAEDPEPLPAIGVTTNSFHVYRLECTLYAREVLSKVFGLTTWHWNRSPVEAAMPLLDEVGRIDAAIKLWYQRIPHALCFEIDEIKGTATPVPRLGTTERDVASRGSHLATQTLLLTIYAHTVLVFLHRPALHSAIWSHDVETAERQVFVSGLTIVVARCRLGLQPLTFWPDLFTFHAALALVQVSLRLLTHPEWQQTAFDTACGALRAASEHFSRSTGAKDGEKARVLSFCLNRLQEQSRDLQQVGHLSLDAGLRPSTGPLLANNPPGDGSSHEVPTAYTSRSNTVENVNSTAHWSALRTGFIS